jgi:nitrite reductase/ring-hydroxylating ferredoxin subunit
MAWRKNAYLNAAHTHIVCSGHGAQFEIATGLCTLGPCFGESLTAVPVAVRPDGVIAAWLEAPAGRMP